MCGIVGILGAGPVTARLVTSLKRLEYRGYDSSGVAVMDDGEGIEIRRAPGKIQALEDVLSNEPADGKSGIAHTRWATHGPVTRENAHPHRAGRVAVVHNGIIENHAQLRSELTAKGRTFQSDTDTEVIAHLIDSHLEARLSPKDAAFKAFDALVGAYAVAVMVDGEPGEIYAARLGPPLAAGLKDGEAFLGSDGVALADHVDNVVYLEDGDRLVLKRDKLEVYDTSGNLANRRMRSIAGSAVLAEKGSYRHFMEKEIHEQPEAASHTLSAYLDAANQDVITPAGLNFQSIDRIQLVACGTAAYAGMVAKYWFERVAGLPTDIDIGSEFRYRKPALTQRTLAIAISQSGETADTKAAIELCAEKGLTTAALVNVEHSTIARFVDVHLPTHAGPEIGVASTKAFTSQLAALAALAVAAGRDRGHLNEDATRRHVATLLEVPRLLARAIETESAIKDLAGELAKAQDVLYLGRGVFYPLALEAALKLKEISYIHAEGYAAGELKHGPIALIDEDTPTVVIAPSDELFDKTMSSIEEVAARKGPVVLITDATGAEKAKHVVHASIDGPQTPVFVAPLVYAAPIQLLAYHIAVEKGTDVDQPRNLAKSVTVE